jgi:hypothetical protein
VEIVNTDHLVLIGSGSEWFWSMISGVVVAVTFILIYRQLRAQGAANALQRIETVHGRWSSTEMVLARLRVAIALRDGTLDPTDDTNIDTILNFFELLRGLHREGYLGDEEVARMFGGPLIAWARLLESAIAEVRAAEGEQQLWDGIDDLVAVVKRWEAKHGVGNTMIWTAPVEALTETLIRRETSRLTLARDAAAGVIPGSDGQHPGPSAGSPVPGPAPVLRADAPG